MATYGSVTAAIAPPAFEASSRTPAEAALTYGSGAATHTLTLGCCLLAIVALAGIFGTLRERRRSRSALRTARSQSEALRELLRTVRMAESMAGLGI